MNLLTERRFSAALLVAIVCLGGAVSFANLSLGEPRTFAYQGRLQQDGAAVDGTRDFRFALTTNTTPLACLAEADLDDNCGHWQEQQAAVAVNAGAFSAVVGQVEDLFEEDLAFNALFLSVAVAESGGPFFLLGTPKQVHPTPQSAVVAEMTNYSVEALTVTGALTAATADVLGDAAVGGILTMAPVGSTARLSSTADEGFMFFSDSDNDGVDTNPAFRVSANSAFFGGQRRELLAVYQNGNADLQGGLATDAISVRDFTDLDSNSGCVVFSGMQICHMPVTSDTSSTWTTHTFDKPFASGEYSIACTPAMSASENNPRYISLRDLTASTFELQTWGPGGSRSGVNGHCIAIGLEGTAW